MASTIYPYYGNGATSNSTAEAAKINVEGAVLLVGGAFVSNANPLPVTGGTSGNVMFVTPTSGNLQTSPVVISNTASIIAPASNNFIHREYQNTGNSVVYIGNSSVTTNTGYPVSAGSAYIFNTLTGALYGISNATQSGSLIEW